VDVALLRQALASFLGDERYWKFVKNLNCEGMRYWMEVAWGRFVSLHPEWAISEPELRVALRVCWMHGVELVPETVKVVKWDAEVSRHFFTTGGYCLPTVAEPGEEPRYIVYNGPASGELSPCARSTALIRWTEGCPFPPRTMVVWYCSECRRVHGSQSPGPAPSIDWARVREIVTGT